MKLGLARSLVLCAATLTGCGYRAAAASVAPAHGLSVASAPLAIPHPEVLQSALAGVRAELGRAGALAQGSAYPRLVVEVLRVDELASGMAATTVAGAGTFPVARGAAVGVTVRGWIEERAGGAPARDTGDVRRVETVSQDADVLAGGVAVEQAARAAARAAGEAMARRALGLAEPAVEPM